MRKILSLFLTLCALLSACAAGKSPIQPAVDFRSALVSAGGCTFTAEVRADFGDYVHDFTLEVAVRKDASTRVRVVAPESIEGICATVTDAGGTVDFDGLALSFGLLAAERLSPIAVPAFAAACWMNAYIVSGGTQEGVDCATYRKNLGENEILVDTFLKKGVPICAEVCYNGKRIAQMVISDFRCN